MFTRILGRATTSFAALLLVAGSLVVAAPAHAEDPTPDPTPTETVAPDPTPSADPEPDPDPTAEPEPTSEPTPTETAAPEPTASPTPDAKPEPTEEPSLSPDTSSVLGGEIMSFEAGTGSVSGTVTLPSGASLGWLSIKLYTAYSEWDYQLTYADEAGYWEFTDLAAGSYQIRFEYDGPQNVVDEWWDDELTSTDATVIELGDDEHLTDLDAELEAGGSISGSIEGPDGPLDSIFVYVYDDNYRAMGNTYSGGDGTFTFSGLPAGTYKVEFDDLATAGGMATEWWEDAEDFDSATPIPVGAQQNVGGIDAVLEAGADISGTVTGGGSGLESIYVELTDPEYGYAVDSTYTGFDGSWSLAGLDPGEYKLKFSDPNDTYATEWYDNALRAEDADVIVVEAAHGYSGFDAALAAGASIAGHVTGTAATDLEGVIVKAYDAHGEMESAWTDEDGHYEIHGLSAGTYRLKFDTCCSGAVANYPGEWWNDKTGFSSATPIALSAGATTTKDAVLAEGAQISGRVLDSEGDGLDGWQVSAYTSSGEFVDGDETEADGSYELTALRAGTYKISVERPWDDETSGLLRTIWWGGGLTLAQATGIPVTGTQVLTGKNVVVPVGSTIEGTISYGDDSPAEGVLVFAQGRSGTGNGQAVTTDENGHYEVDGLSSGRYIMGFTVQGPGATLYSGGGTEPAHADVLVLGSTSLVYDVELPWGGPPTGSVSGTLVDSAGDPVDGWVDLRDASGSPIDSYGTDDGGDFTIDGLFEGSYTLVAGTADGPATTWWSGSASQAGADPIDVAVGQSVALGNVALLDGGVISGVVTGPDGVAVRGAYVYAYSADGEAYVNDDATGSTGSYSIVGLPAGEYTLIATKYEGGLVDTWWGGTYLESTADELDLASGQHRSDVDIQMLRGATVSGSHPLVGDAQVDLFDADGVSIDTQFLSAGDGSYRFEGLIPGKYRAVLNSNDPDLRFVSATTFTVTSLTQQLVRNFTSAATTGTITGEVTDTAGDPIVGTIVIAWSTSTTAGVAMHSSASPDGEGHYELQGLLPGSYKVGFSDHASALGATTPEEFLSYGGIFYEPQFATGAATPSSAVVVAVTAGQTRSGYDATLAAKGETAAFTAAATPTITVPSGGTKVGQILTAVKGTWTPTPASTGYQWNRDGTPIPGATSSTYKLVAADAGAVITVTVTGSKIGYTTTSKTSAPTATVTGGVLSPTPTPTILGTAEVGQELGANTGVWGPGDVDLQYQWKRDGVSIPGADGSQYVLENVDAGSKITVTVTGSRSGYTSVAKTSAATGIVTGGVFATSATTLTGTPKVGSKLTAVRGTWTPTPTTVTYRWYRNGVLIPGAAASTYTVVTADAGKSISVEVFGSRAGFETASAMSDPTAMVTGGVFASAPTPKITGIAAKGGTLSVQTGTWSPAPSFAYQWKRSGVAIAGADGLSYVLTGDDVGAKITVTVTGTLRGYEKSVTSAATSAVFDTMTVGEPTVSGDLTAGSVLTASLGTWPDAPTSYLVSWLRDGLRISGATKLTYTTTTADIGARISVQVIGVKTGFMSGVSSSDETDPIAGREFTQTSDPVIQSPLAGAVVGQTLKAVVPEPWLPTPTFSYQWLRDGAPIAKATSSSYKLVSLDAGAQISVRVTGSKALYSPVSGVSDPTPEVTGGVFAAPTPKITGSAVNGATLTAVPGTWSPTPDLSYQWKANGVAIPDADGTTYVVQQEDIGAKITVTVTGEADGVITKSVTSAATATVLDAFELGDPSVSGDVLAGSVLTASPGTWPDAPTKFAFQWLRDGAVITNATKISYTTTTADIGKQVSVRVSASKAGFATTSITAPPVEIEGRTFTTAPDPTITVPAAGLIPGQTLKAVPGVWSPTATFSYRWLRDGSPIADAKASSYKLTSADHEAQITVEVTGSKALYAPTVRTSDPTAEVGGGIIAPVTPTITVPAAGAVVGQTLKVATGAWSPTPTFAYQWLRDGAPIAKATSSSYKLVAADAGSLISVKVTGTKTGYVDAWRVSGEVGMVVGGSAAPAIPAVGDFIVGESVEPGTYVTVGTPASCYWERLSALDGAESSVIVSSSAAGQRIVTILESDYAFSSFGCNGWIPLEDSAAPQATSFRDGEYAVGQHIYPGEYTSDGAGTCRWLRLGDFDWDSINLDEGTVTGPATVTIEPTDAGFASYGCGTWTFQAAG